MQIRENFSLRSFNTFGIDVRAKGFASFTSVDELTEILSGGASQRASVLILGGGSNILFTRDYNGIVLKNEMEGIEVMSEDEDAVYIRCGGGVNWHRFVLYCMEQGYAGVENLSLIPGSVGAAPMQNIGAYGMEVKDVFFSLDAWHIKDQAVQTFYREDCAFGYRESIFKRKYKDGFVILNVTCKLSKTPVFHTSYGAIQQELDAMKVEELSIQAVSQAVINIRTSKLPDWKKLGNAGSFFKNPQIPSAQFQSLRNAFPGIVGFPVNDGSTKLAAGWLIEQCGWKGYRKGDAGCYAKQALVLVNYGSATGSEIFDLSEKIITSVKRKFNVLLEREVNIV